MKLITILLLAITIAGCSTNKVIKATSEADNLNINLVAFLPVDGRSDMPRERVEAVRRSVKVELQSRGYTLLEDSIVARVCSDIKCENKQSLVDTYKIDGFVTLSLTSIARANFLAGYINTVSGKLALVSIKGDEILSIEQTEREKGGILFNSGQVAEAIKSTVGNAAVDDSFAKLATRFSKDLVSKFPSPQGGNNISNQAALKLDSYTIKGVTSNSQEVCVYGPPNSFAYVTYQGRKSNLRQVSSGKYCGLYRSEDLLMFPYLDLELRSAYGEVAQKRVEQGDNLSCRLPTTLEASLSSGKLTIPLQCGQENAKAKFEIYKAQSSIGPYKRVAEVSSNSWSYNQLDKDSVSVYAVVAVNKSGYRTAPALATVRE